MSQTLFDTDDTHTDAILSDDGRYRYWLSRRWQRHGPLATFVMLNPSTADATQDDPTIRRCIGFAKRWGLSGIAVVNLYALRSTDPSGLWLVDDPVGAENDGHIEAAAAIAYAHDAPLIASWGANARPDRVAEVVQLHGMDRLTALGVTLAGAPKHPLARGLHRIPDDARPVPWEVPA